MKKLTLFTTSILMLLVMKQANAQDDKLYDFAVENKGQTIYYNITSATPPLTVEVTHEKQAVGANLSYIGHVHIPDSVTYQDTTYTVTSIGISAFEYCLEILSVTLPTTVTTIGNSAFRSCTFRGISIPHSVVSIEDNAFIYCRSLVQLSVEAEVPPLLGNAVFGSVPNTIPVYVPCGKGTAYKNAPGWDYFPNIKEDCIGVKDIRINHETILSPNPATDNISITLPENVSQAVFTVYDMQGKVLIKQKISNQETVAVNNLAAGVYIYNIRTDKQNYQGKLIRK
jgi:hypothetical protein